MTDLLALSRPGHNASHGDALQTRDPQATVHSNMDPASAPQRCTLHRVRDTEVTND
jgi:hypothetical protein